MGGSVELVRYFRIAKKWWWLILVGTCVAAGAGFAVSRMLPPVYRTSASLLVKVDASTVFTGEQLALTYKELLTKQPVIERVAQTFGLDPRQVEKSVQVQLIYETSLIQITAQASDPHLAAGLANGIIAAFMQISREADSIQVRDLVVVEPATPPARPVSPRLLLNTLVAAMVGFLLAVGTIFVVEYLDDTLTTIDDAQKALPVPTLTVVPRLRGRAKRSPALTILDDPAAPQTEAYRTLRARIRLSCPPDSVPILLITSPTECHEKAQVAINLGIVTAQTGLKVLLVDANLRQPRLHQVLGLAGGPGLSTLSLESTQNYRDYIIETTVPNLLFLPGGPSSPDPLDMLGSQEMGQFVKDLGTQADVVILDTSPILAFADTAILASQANGARTILVVESQFTRESAAKRALDVLDGVGAEVLGTVLSRAPIKPARYRYYSEFAPASKNGQARGAP
jgi:capsular exopolysaccharide synthesis family protein